MARDRQALGRWGEERAAQYLLERGFTLVDRNRRTPYGEIDLIVQDQHTLVFVEVKTRTSDTYGLPEASITAKKRAHLISAAQAYLQARPEIKKDWRIDVIAIRKLNSSQPPEITYFKNAVS